MACNNPNDIVLQIFFEWFYNAVHHGTEIFALTEKKVYHWIIQSFSC